MDTDSLRQFLIRCNKAGYASIDLIRQKDQADLSTTIAYEDGDWKMHDNYFGGEPYGGREVIFYKNKPVWIMVYYGWIVPEERNDDVVEKFLQKALRALPEDMPLRGPEKLDGENMHYTNKWEGDLTNYKGEEKIFKDDKQVYKAYYMGGLIDQ